MTQKVEKADYKDVLLFKNGTTDDIIKVLLDTVKMSLEQTKVFAQSFSTDRKGMNDLYDFLIKEIKYKEDPWGQQWIKTPARFYADKIGDCKSYTVFVISVLHNLGLKYEIRFASYEKDNIVTHVYPIAILPNGKKIIIDAVWGNGGGSFDSEKKFTFKKDYNMTEIHRLSGIGSYPNHQVNGWLQDGVDWVKDKWDDLGEFWRNKTVNKIAILTLHSYYPYPVAEGSRMHDKIQKAKKLKEILIKESKFNRIDSDAELIKAIKEKTGKTPEEIFREALPEPPQIAIDPSAKFYTAAEIEKQKKRDGAQGIGVITTATATLIIGLVGVAWGIIQYFIMRRDDLKMQKEDAYLEQEAMLRDTVFLTQQQQKTVLEQQQRGEAGGRTNGNDNEDTDNEDTDNNQMAMVGLGLAAAYFLLND